MPNGNITNHDLFETLLKIHSAISELQAEIKHTGLDGSCQECREDLIQKINSVEIKASKPLWITGGIVLFVSFFGTICGVLLGLHKAGLL